MTNALANLPPHLFDHLSDTTRDCLLSKAWSRRFSRGTTVCLRGDPAQTVKIVQSGWVKLYRMQPDGNEAVMATLSDGQSFDEIEALTGDASPSSAEALSDCTVMQIDLSSICECRNARSEITRAVLSATSRHLSAMRDDVEQMKASTGAERLLHYLADLSAGQDDRTDFELPYDKVVLAGKLGMRPESLSRAFSRLKPLGVRSHNRQIRIADVRLLQMGLTEDLLAA